MTMSTMGWGVKSPASQALVHPPAPGTLKGNQPKCLDSGLWAISPPFPVIPPTRKSKVVDKVMS